MEQLDKHVKNFFKFKHLLETAYLSRDRDIIHESIENAASGAQSSAEFRELGTCRLVQLWDVDGTYALYQQAYDTAARSIELLELAEEVIHRLDQKQWGHEILNRAAELLIDELRADAHTSLEILERMVNAFVSLLHDEQSALSLLNRCSGCIATPAALVQYARIMGQFSNTADAIQQSITTAHQQASSAQDYCIIAQAYIDLLDQPKAAACILETARHTIKTCSDYALVADHYMTIHDDYEATLALIRESVTHAHSCSDYCAIARVTAVRLNDRGAARQLLERAEKRALNGNDFVLIAELAITVLDDFQWGQFLFNAAEINVDSSKEYTTLGYSVYTHLRDKHRAASLFRAALKSAENITDFLALAGGLPDLFGGEEFRIAVLRSWEEHVKQTDFRVVDYLA